MLIMKVEEDLDMMNALDLEKASDVFFEYDTICLGNIEVAPNLFAEIRFVNDNPPFIDAVLFKKHSDGDYEEVCVLETIGKIDGVYWFEYEGVKYPVIVEFE